MQKGRTCSQRVLTGDFQGIFRWLRSSLCCCSPFPSSVVCGRCIPISTWFPSSAAPLCWFSSMSLVLHSTEIWLATRQTPVEWRTTEPMDRPHCRGFWVFGEARLGHPRCSGVCGGVNSVLAGILWPEIVVFLPPPPSVFFTSVILAWNKAATLDTFPVNCGNSWPKDGTALPLLKAFSHQELLQIKCSRRFFVSYGFYKGGATR